jgi:hypothetical protein
MDLLNTITSLSHEFGTADFVKGGGGNTSAKNADTLWVKPSGTTLAGLTPQSFIAMSRAKPQSVRSVVAMPLCGVRVSVGRPTRRRAAWLCRRDGEHVPPAETLRH